MIVALGDVAGKGSPAALLMALLLAVLRTLVDERLEPAPLVERLNAQICRHSPGSRFITLFYGVYDPVSGELIYVNAGQNPPLIRRVDGRYERAARNGRRARHVRGVALRSRRRPRSILASSWCSTATASPRPKTPPASPSRSPGSSRCVDAHASREPGPAGGRTSSRQSSATPSGPSFIDDLTILLLKRAAA